jgi:hypothetical protein
MDDKTRGEIVERIIDDAVDSLQQEAELQNEVAAYRAMMVKALERLPMLLCAEHLEHDLAKFAGWIERERAALRPEAH